MSPLSRPARRRIVLALVALLVLVLLVVVPPAINVGRYARKISTSVSNAIGRPVRIDNVSMHVLPLPGLTLENFVVSEDPHFGNEPVMRANTVNATIRWSSLWRGKLEISTISLVEPSVNLVRNADGRWNIESLLLHASRVDAAPTEQKRPGAAPRFPYIEATDGRLNIKMGEEKTPYSLTGADFALWLPNPQEWRMRIKARPTRTDTDASDTGEFRAEATLHRAPSAKDVPVQMEMRWRKLPLGEASKILLGHDSGWRGEAELSLNMDGTLGDASITSEFHLNDVRRFDFVAPRLMQIDAHCEAHATGLLHQLRGVRCSIPVDAAAPSESEAPAQTSSQPSAQPSAATPDQASGSSTNASSSSSAQPSAPGSLALTADIPDTAHFDLADTRIDLSGVAPNYALDWLRLFSKRIPLNMRATGSLDGHFSHGPATAQTWDGNVTCDCAILLAEGNGKPTALPLHLTGTVDDDGTGGRTLHVTIAPPDRRDASSATRKSTASPAAISPTLRGGNADITVNAEGFQARVHSGNPVDFVPALLMRFPPIGDNMPSTCTTSDCTLQRRWNSPSQTWQPTPAPARPAPRKRSR